MTVLPFIEGTTYQRIYTDPNGMKVFYDFSSGNQPIYIGESLPGSGTADIVWRLQKRTYDGTKLVKIEWAEGDARYNKTWDSRASYAYS